MPLWDEKLLKNPHQAADKRQRVRGMFTAIAPSYDLNNRLHSLWQDQRWRKKAVKLTGLRKGETVVDVACGTGDLALQFSRSGAARVLGVDFTYAMLPIAAAKAQAESRLIEFINGDALALPLPDDGADVASIAFGIRNVADPLLALREFYRVLRPGGRVVVLEFSLPENALMRWLYNFYFRKVLPRTATWISRDKTGAYKYLPESVNTFIGRETMLDLMRQAGFSQVKQCPMTLGVCVGYVGVK